MISIQRFNEKTKRPCLIHPEALSVVDLGLIPEPTTAIKGKTMRPRYAGLCIECLYELRDRAVRAVNERLEEDES